MDEKGVWEELEGTGGAMYRRYPVVGEGTDRHLSLTAIAVPRPGRSAPWGEWKLFVNNALVRCDSAPTLAQAQRACDDFAGRVAEFWFP